MIGPTEEETICEFQRRLTRVLRNLLKPVTVKSLTITRADRYTIQGIVLTVCPIERRESGRDFELGLAGDEENSIRYVIVDGRRLFPRRTRTRHQDAASPPRLRTAWSLDYLQHRRGRNRSPDDEDVIQLEQPPRLTERESPVKTTSQ